MSLQPKCCSPGRPWERGSPGERAVQSPGAGGVLIWIYRIFWPTTIFMRSSGSLSSPYETGPKSKKPAIANALIIAIEALLMVFLYSPTVVTPPVFVCPNGEFSKFRNSGGGFFTMVANPDSHVSSRAASGTSCGKSGKPIRLPFIGGTSSSRNGLIVKTFQPVFFTHSLIVYASPKASGSLGWYRIS